MISDVISSLMSNSEDYEPVGELTADTESISIEPEQVSSEPISVEKYPRTPSESKYAPSTISIPKDEGISDSPLKKFRKKFVFSGFKGSESISRLGTFSIEEASILSQIKTSNIHSGVSPSMPDNIRKKIIHYSIKYDLDPDSMLTYAQIESGGNPYAISSSGAIGVYQITGQTASALGIRNRFDLDQNIEGAMRLTVMNKKKLSEKSGLKNSRITSSALGLYISHQIGVNAASEVFSKFIKSPNATISSLSSTTVSGIRSNIGGKYAYIRDYLEENKRKLKEASKKVSSNSEVQKQLSYSIEYDLPTEEKVASYSDHTASLMQNVLRTKNGVLVAI